jgi:glycerol-3-phosphate dehydrogenase (NAD(P)+)
VNEHHENAVYLAGVPLPRRLATNDLQEAVDRAEMAVLAAPSHATRAVRPTSSPSCRRHIPIVCVSKGIENDTLLTMTEVLEDVFPTSATPTCRCCPGRRSRARWR